MAGKARSRTVYSVGVEVRRRTGGEAEFFHHAVVGGEPATRAGGGKDCTEQGEREEERVCSFQLVSVHVARDGKKYEGCSSPVPIN